MMIVVQLVKNFSDFNGMFIIEFMSPSPDHIMSKLNPIQTLIL
jgi:hypothetical protein